MPDQPRPDTLKESRSEQLAPVDSDQLGAPSSEPRRPWGRLDRNRLLVFIGIGIIAPAPFILALHFLTKSTGSVFSVQDELPVKAVTAFFAVLATWIVSRKEKRPPSDYGIPPRVVRSAILGRNGMGFCDAIPYSVNPPSVRQFSD